MRLFRDLLNLASAAAVAGMLLWVFGAEFANSVAPYPFDETIGRHLPAPGSSLRFRTEGWATTHYAEHGLLAVDVEALASRPDTLPPPILVGVWGDSFVQGVHVDDGMKFSSQFRRLLGDDSEVALVAIGQPGWDVTDVVDLVDRYEALYDFEAQLLVLHDLFDFSPNEETFVTDPAFRFVSRERHPPAPRLRSRLAALRLDFVWVSWERLFLAHRNPVGGAPLRWRPGPVPSTAKTWPSWTQLEEVSPAAWDFALDRLVGSSQRRWTIVYIPRIPFFDGGRVQLEEPAVGIVRRFAEHCSARGVEFVDLSDRLKAFYLDRGRSAFGFDNGQVGRGHLNADGHRILAEALVEWSREQGFGVDD